MNVIYYRKYLFMFLASICPSSGVQVVCCCIWYSAIGVVAVVLRSRCLFLCTVCKFASSHIQTYTQRTRLHTGSLGPQPQHLVLNTICSTYNLYSWRWAYRCPKHVQIFIIINHNCCIKLVPLFISLFIAFKCFTKMGRLVFILSESHNMHQQLNLLTTACVRAIIIVLHTYK